MALALFGPTAAGARVLSIAAGAVAVALVAPIARALWPQPMWRVQAGVVALWMLALNPFAISFAPTAYTDTLLLALGLAALAGALLNRPLAAGVALGAAIMTKQQGLLFLPLILALPWAHAPSQTPLRATLRVGLGLALVVAPVLLWDASRWASAPSPWDLGAQNYAALTLARAATWPARAAAWGEPVWHLVASPWAWLLVGGAALWGILLGFVHPAWRPTGAVRLLAAWGAAVALLHLVTTVQPWDRYLLPLVAVLVLLAAGPLAAALAALGRRGAPWRAAGAALLLLVLLPPGLAAARGGLPVGGDHGGLAGLDAAAAWLAQEAAQAAAAGAAPPAVYQQRLGWQLGFSLADPLRRGQVDVRWFASPTALADSAAKLPHRTRLLIEPDWAQAGTLGPALAARGLTLETVVREGHVRIDRIVPAPWAEAACAWCLNRLPAPPPHWSVAPTGDQSRLQGAP